MAIVSLGTQPGDVISYMEMCSAIGVNLQRGMNFCLRDGERSFASVDLHDWHERNPVYSQNTVVNDERGSGATPS